MEKGRLTPEPIIHAGFVYTAPEGKDRLSQTTFLRPSKFDDIRQEASFHLQMLGYSKVAKIDRDGWTMESLLDAIEAGYADVFMKNSVRFPPTFEGEWYTTFTAVRFDDRDFGERMANTVLAGFNRQPRLPQNPL